ncbi:hypothetical protein T484DRAFT_1935351 [Baffinella frigidus]|nr:hypothetical protein T484DRAFT_1935351 [Cryptophyta sp. CCMP2293]
MVYSEFSLQWKGDGQGLTAFSPPDEPARGHPGVDPGFAGLSFRYSCRNSSDISDILEGQRPRTGGSRSPNMEEGLGKGGNGRQLRSGGGASKASGRPYSPSIELSASPFCAPGSARPSPDRLQGEPRRQNSPTRGARRSGPGRQRLGATYGASAGGGRSEPQLARIANLFPSTSSFLRFRLENLPAPQPLSEPSGVFPQDSGQSSGSRLDEHLGFVELGDDPL